VEERDVRIPAGKAVLAGTLASQADSRGLVVFAHGSGSGRHSPRNRLVAATLNDAGIETLLMDLLTADEERVDAATGSLRFDIGLLTERVRSALAWVHERNADASVGLFGASTGAAAALSAAAADHRVRAVVSRGGRPDLALEDLPGVAAPVLLIVGGEDRTVLQMNRKALASLAPPARLEVVRGASHLFEEPGTLERVAELARDWFLAHLS